MEFKEQYRLKRLMRETLAIRNAHDLEVGVLRRLLDLRKQTMFVSHHIMGRPYSNRDILDKVTMIRVLRKELDRIRETHGSQPKAF